MSGESDSAVARISVLDPVSRAADWAGRVLFRPFDFEKWLVLGFCAWLARLGEGGSSGGSSSWSEDADFDGAERGARELGTWALDHLVPVLIVGAFVVALVIAVVLLVLWVSSRGKFMFLDGVVHNRAAVVEPWRRLRVPGDALFVFRLLVGLGFLGLLLVIATLMAWLLWLGFEADELRPPVLLGLALVVPLFVAVVCSMLLVRLAINDFIVPLMYLRGCGVGEACRELGALVSGRPGTFVLYVLVKIVMAVAIAMITMMACCLTCCVALLPYVGTVILLPVWVFVRAYPLYFLGQFGPSYAPFATLGSEGGGAGPGAGAKPPAG